MIIPKKIEKLLDRREKLGVELINASAELDKWLAAHGADFSDTDIRDSVVTGCMIYVESETANRNVREYIENKLPK